MIDFVAVCRTYASELAINEVTLRTYSDLQQYVEQSTEGLVQCRAAATARRAYRQMQVKAAIRFCGSAVRTGLRLSDEPGGRNAVTGERKPQASRAGCGMIRKKRIPVFREASCSSKTPGRSDGSRKRQDRLGGPALRISAATYHS